MTERERVRNEAPRAQVGVYDTPGRATNAHGATHADDVNLVKVADQVRWGPIIAGLFTALTTLAVLAVLGLAIGLSSYDANDPLGSFGIGAGIWGAISALIAFALGGYMAGGTARVRGNDSGILNGALVWIVAIPLMLFLLSSGLGALLGTATNLAGAATTAAGAAAGAAAEDPAVQATAQAAAGAAQDAAAQVTPQDAENVANNAGRGAWGTLLWLGLGALASIVGGYLGSRGDNPRRTVVTS